MDSVNDGGGGQSVVDMEKRKGMGCWRLKAQDEGE